MSPKGNKKVKVAKKFAKKSEEQKVQYPVEVLLYDCITKQRVVGSYAGESKWWYGTRLYKVYHPSFDGGFRWVMKLGRILGYYNPAEEYPSQESLKDEQIVIDMLMAG